MSSHKSVNKSLGRLKAEEFSNLATSIQSMKNLGTGLTNMNGHGHIRVEPRIQVTNTVERLDSRIADGDRINCDF